MKAICASVKIHFFLALWKYARILAAAAVAAAVSRPFDAIEGAMNTARSDLSRVKSNIQNNDGK